MNAQDIERCVVIKDDARELLKHMAKRLELSGRAFHRVIKVAQTIADLSAEKWGDTEIRKDQILEAIQYRKKFE